MSDRDELEKSYGNKIDLYDKFLDGAREANERVPDAEEGKKLAEAMLEAIKNTPDGLIEELYPNLLVIQLRDEQILRDSVEPFYVATRENVLIIESSTGTSSAHVEIVRAATNVENWPIEKRNRLISPFIELAEDRSRSSEIPKKLNKLNENLGEMFTIAQTGIKKANAGTLNVNQAAMDMRNVLQQIWGGLVRCANIVNPDKLNGIKHLQFRKETHRERVAASLMSNELDKDILKLLLDNMCRLSSEISPSDFGKNPLSKQIFKLNDIYRRWITQIDDLVNLVNIPEEGD